MFDCPYCEALIDVDDFEYRVRCPECEGTIRLTWGYKWDELREDEIGVIIRVEKEVAYGTA